MHALARLLQLAGLVILPLTIPAQLSGRITVGQMLQFMMAGIALFGIGYLLQQHGGSRR